MVAPRETSIAGIPIQHGDPGTEVKDVASACVVDGKILNAAKEMMKKPVYKQCKANM